VTGGNVTEGRSEAERDTDPLPSSAAAEVVAEAQGRSGVPTGHTTPDAIASANERTGPRSFADPSASAGGAALHRTGAKRKEEADGVTAVAGASCAAGSLRLFRIRRGSV